MRSRQTNIGHRFAPGPVPALFALAASFLLLSCEGNSGFPGISGPDQRAWVANEPIQCLGNPWEQDWLERHANDYSAYPMDQAAQNTILTEYYSRQGVRIYTIVSIPKYQGTCDACGCPRGDMLYLLVGRDDTREMIQLGYRLEEPRWFAPTRP